MAILTCPNCNEIEFKVEKGGDLVCLNCGMVGEIEDNPRITWKWEELED